MDIKALNKDLDSLILTKAKLAKLTYDHQDYDRVEEELHDMEDDFLEKYGDEMEEVLDNVHEKLKSDNDVLLPIAYLPKAPSVKKDDKGNNLYELTVADGVQIDVPGKKGDVRLVVLSNPPRIILAEGKNQTTLWEAK